MNNDLISRNDLKEDMKSRLSKCNEWIEKAKDKETKIRASAVKAFICEVIMTIDNAPTVEPTYQMPKDYIKNKLDYDRSGDVLDQDAKEASIPYSYNSERQDNSAK